MKQCCLAILKHQSASPRSYLAHSKQACPEWKWLISGKFTSDRGEYVLNLYDQDTFSKYTYSADRRGILSKENQGRLPSSKEGRFLPTAARPVCCCIE